MNHIGYKLFLDDERDPNHVTWGNFRNTFYNTIGQYCVVRNYEGFCRTITERGLPESVSFDHDLGKEHYKSILNNFKDLEENYEKTIDSYKEKTGYHCAKWLFEYCLEKRLNLPRFHVHSMNPVGAERIRNLLESYDKTYRAFHG
jgi:hypothetical protein